MSAVSEVSPEGPSVNDDSVSSFTSSSRFGSATKWLEFARSLKLELILFIVSMTFSMRYIVTQDLFLKKSCLYTFQHNETYCDKYVKNNSLSNSSNFGDGDDITKEATLYSLYLILAQFIPSSIIAVLMSSWCDHHGHKIPVFIVLAGSIAMEVGTIFTVFYLSVPMYVNILCGLVSGLTGGLVAMSAFVQSAASKSTSEELRTIKFYFVMVGLVVGIQAGQFLGGQIYNAGGYAAVYCTSAGLLMLSLFGIAPFVDESVVRTMSQRQMFMDLLKLNHFKEGWEAAFRRRENGGRTKMLLFAAAIAVILFNGELTRSITYYFMYNKYHWSVTRYSNVNSGFAVVDLFASAACIFIGSKVYKIPDLILAVVGIISFMVSFIIKGLMEYSWLYYIACVSGVLTNVGPVAISSYISKLIPADEATKVFSFWSSCESWVPVLGNVFSTLVFRAVLNGLPGLPFLIGAGFLLFPLTVAVYYFRKDSVTQSDVPYGTLQNNSSATIMPADSIPQQLVKDGISVIVVTPQPGINESTRTWTPDSPCLM